MSDERPLPEIRLLSTLQIVCAASAVASLKPGMIHPLWLASFIVPAMVFLGLGAPRMRRFIVGWLRLVIAVIVQGGAAYATALYLGPDSLDQKSALACSLLPVLTYFTLRREPADTSLSLFLSFCFLLIGIMLNDNKADWTLLVFLGACPWAMQIEASNRGLQLRHAVRGKAMPLGTRVLRRAQVVVALMLVALVTFFIIQLVPSPTDGSARQRSKSAASHGNRSVGLNHKFDLSGADGSPLNLTANKVVRASEPSGIPVPTDLYLRMTAFDRAGVHEWRTWPVSSVVQNLGAAVFWCRERIRAPGRELGVQRLTVERLEPPTDGEMFLPPGTLGLTGIKRLEFDRRTGHYRSMDKDDRGYRVIYQQPHKERPRGGIDPSLGALGDRLTEIPETLKTDELVRLAREFAGPVPRSRPVRLAEHIADRLQERCSYVLKEPVGLHDDAVHNFLFGNHQGYCMHFATSLALMLRLSEVPCRIAVGFHTGERNPDGSRTFGAQHAHAWVELPIEGYGWIVVDPTPAADRARRGWPDPSLRQSADGAGPDADANRAGANCLLAAALPFLEQPLAILSDPLENPGAFLFLAAVFLVITISLVMLLVRRAQRRGSPGARHRPTPDCVRARQLLDRILGILARHGLAKHQRFTLEQYAAQLEGRGTGLDLRALAGAFDAYQQVRFGNKPLDQVRQTRLCTALDTVRAMKS